VKKASNHLQREKPSFDFEKMGCNLELKKDSAALRDSAASLQLCDWSEAVHETSRLEYQLQDFFC